MPLATPTPVPALATDLPDPSDRTTYGPRGRAVWNWEVNTLVPGINAIGQAAYDNAAHAETMANSAGVTAGFAGAWASLSGVLNVPASVYYPHVDADYWVLVVSVTNVEAHTPGVSAAFAPFGASAGSVAFDNTGTDIVAEDVQAAIVELSERRGIGRNRVVNGNFAVNQGAVSGTVVLVAGAYGHDQWKAGASGCTYTFATSGGINTLTISAGSLIQPIEGVSLQTGTHTLSWTGTSQGKIGGGSYGASGLTASVTGGADTTIEFNTGTLSLVQLEPGDMPSLFEFLDPTTDFNRCCRFYWAGSIYWSGQATSAGRAGAAVKFPVRMRSTPTIGDLVATALSGFPAGTPSYFGQTSDGLTMDKIANSTLADGRWGYTFTANARLP